MPEISRERLGELLDEFEEAVQEYQRECARQWYRADREWEVVQSTRKAIIEYVIGDRDG